MFFTQCDTQADLFKTVLRVLHVTSVVLYACESWILTAELQRRIQAVEMRCYRKILSVSYKHRVTNGEVRAKTQQATKTS